MYPPRWKTSPRREEPVLCTTFTVTTTIVSTTTTIHDERLLWPDIRTKGKWPSAQSSSSSDKRNPRLTQVGRSKTKIRWSPDKSSLMAFQRTAIKAETQRPKSLETTTCSRNQKTCYLCCFLHRIRPHYGRKSDLGRSGQGVCHEEKVYAPSLINVYTNLSIFVLFCVRSSIINLANTPLALGHRCRSRQTFRPLRVPRMGVVGVLRRPPCSPPPPPPPPPVGCPPRTPQPLVVQASDHRCRPASGHSVTTFNTSMASTMPLRCSEL